MGITCGSEVGRLTSFPCMPWWSLSHTFKWPDRVALFFLLPQARRGCQRALYLMFGILSFSFLSSKLERLCFAVGCMKYIYVSVAVLVRKSILRPLLSFWGWDVWPVLWFIGPCCCCVCTAFSVSRCLGNFFDLASGWLTNREWEKIISLFIIVRETLSRESAVPEKSSGGWTIKGKTVRGEEIKTWECYLGEGFGLEQWNVWTWHIF